jgi:hypothetical protein
MARISTTIEEKMRDSGTLNITPIQVAQAEEVPAKIK